MAPWLLGGILAVGFGLRVLGLDFGLPNQYCRPDETTLVYKALSIGAGDPNPHFFNYPSLQFYLLAALYALYLACGWLVGTFVDIASFQDQFFHDPSPFYLIGRFATVCFSTASIYWVWLLGAALGGRRTGLLAAFFFATAFLHVRDSHFLTVDVPALFYALGAMVYALRSIESSRHREWLISGVLMGCALSTKYTMVLLVGAPLLAFILGARLRRQATPWKRLIGWGVAVGGVFVLGSPFVLIDFAQAWQDIAFERAHFAQGHGLDLGRGWGYHAGFTLPLGLGWPLYVAGLAGVAWLAWRRRPVDWVVLSALMLYFGVAGSGKAVFVRYMLPVVPLLCLAAAALLGQWMRRWPPVLVCLLGGLIVYPSVSSSWAFGRLLTQKDTRVLAAEWIEQHIPTGSRLAAHGTDFALPRLRPEQHWLQERYQDLRRAGLPGKRLAYLLARPVTGPAYYTVELNEENAAGFRSVAPYFTREALVKNDLRWIILVEHPLARRIHTGLWREVAQNSRLVAHFEPFVDTAPQKPVYDPIDAFYVPLAGFSQVKRPGPTIYIFHLASDRP